MDEDPSLERKSENKEKATLCHRAVTPSVIRFKIPEAWGRWTLGLVGLILRENRNEEKILPKKWEKKQSQD